MATELTIRRKHAREKARCWNEPIRVNEAQPRRACHDLFLVFQKILPCIEEPVRTRAGTLLLVPRVPDRILVVLRITLRLRFRDRCIDR